MDDIIEISYIKNEKWKEDNDAKHVKYRVKYIVIYLIF